MRVWKYALLQALLFFSLQAQSSLDNLPFSQNFPTLFFLQGFNICLSLYLFFGTFIYQSKGYQIYFFLVLLYTTIVQVLLFFESHLHPLFFSSLYFLFFFWVPHLATFLLYPQEEDAGRERVVIKGNKANEKGDTFGILREHKGVLEQTEVQKVDRDGNLKKPTTHELYLVESPPPSLLQRIVSSPYFLCLTLMTLAEAILRFIYIYQNVVAMETTKELLSFSDKNRDLMSIARECVDIRNQNKGMIRRWDLDFLRIFMEKRNIKKYGDALGPSLEWLIKKKTEKLGTNAQDVILMDVIQSTNNTNDTVDQYSVLLGILFFIMFSFVLSHWIHQISKSQIKLETFLVEMGRTAGSFLGGWVLTRALGWSLGVLGDRIGFGGSFALVGALLGILLGAPKGNEIGKKFNFWIYLSGVAVLGYLFDDPDVGNF